MIIFLIYGQKTYLDDANLYKSNAWLKKEIEAVTPNSYYPSIYKIDYQTLKKEKIDTLLFDIDNTITKVDDLNIPKKLLIY